MAVDSVYIHSRLTEKCSGLRRLSEQLLETQTAFGTTFRDTGGYQKAGTSSLKTVTGRIYTISK